MLILILFLFGKSQVGWIAEYRSCRCRIELHHKRKKENVVYMKKRTGESPADTKRVLERVQNLHRWVLILVLFREISIRMPMF